MSVGLQVKEVVPAVQVAMLNIVLPPLPFTKETCFY
jgi:hypothetical protein